MKIAFVGQPEYFRFMYERDLDFLGHVEEFPFHFSMKEEDFEDLKVFDADFNFFFRGEFFPSKVLESLRGVKINLSSEPFPNIYDGQPNFTRDSLARFKWFLKIKNKDFDYIFHYDPTSRGFLEKLGISLSGYFPFPVATGVYKKIDLPKKWDFFFIGRSTKHRERFFGPLKHHFNFLHICHGIWGEELVEYANRSKILLNVHAENEISWEPRIQMLMATGNLLISETISDNDYLIPGKDYIHIDSPQDLYEKASYFLKHEDEREEIALSGMEKILKRLDSKKNFLTLIEGINSSTYLSPVFSSKQRLPFSLVMTAILSDYKNRFLQRII